MNKLSVGASRPLALASLVPAQQLTFFIADDRARSNAFGPGDCFTWAYLRHCLE